MATDQVSLLDLKSLSLSEDNRRAKKATIRQKTWDLMEKTNSVRDFPRPCHERIPNFKGKEHASELLSHLDAFKAANVVKVNPSLAQMEFRQHVLFANKTLIVPSPSLAPTAANEDSDGDVFCYMIPGEALSNTKKRKAITKAGSVKFGHPLLLDWSLVGHIDLVVVGSVAVTQEGVRLGKGMGYAELEWGILVELGVIDESTVVATSVHERQIVPKALLPVDIMEAHDLPVDIIVTNRRVIHVKGRLKKPIHGVIWDLLTDKDMEDMAILRLLKEKNNKN